MRLTRLPATHEQYIQYADRLSTEFRRNKTVFGMVPRKNKGLTLKGCPSCVLFTAARTDL